jgi:putative CocE/NonD family hydrolase
MDFEDEQVRWFDQRLKGIDNGMDNEPPIHIFVMGENVWRFENEWPLARTQYTNYYLHSDGSANTMSGDGTLSESAPTGDEPVDTYTYDPDDPVWTLGGQIMAIQMTLSGPRDRRPVERRQDVLVYTTDPLERDVEVTGPISLVLHASTSARDTDFTGTLIDVHPDGKAISICEGLLRTRYRDSIEEPTLINPGETYEFNVEIWETSNMFKAGHRIRLEVSSSNFPRFDRNPNTGNRPGMDAEIQVADQTIYHDAKRPSRLILPIIPR